KRGQAICNRFVAACELFDSAGQILKGGDVDVDAFLTQQNKSAKSIIKELVSNSLAEFHYIDCSYPGQDCNGYVIRLREVRFISAEMALAVRDGLDVDAYRERFPSGDPGLIVKTENDFAMPLGVVESPFIELI